MRIYYYKSDTGNFGDDLNVWLWPRLLPNKFDGFALHMHDSETSYSLKETIFVGIGTLLNSNIPRTPNKLIFGTGAGYENGGNITIDKKWDISFVRGPITAKHLGISEQKIITDSAMLVRLLDIPKYDALHKVSFMAFHRNRQMEFLKNLCASYDVHFIDPRQPVEETLKSIRSSELLITEAMHGAIVADALRVPWIPIKSSPKLLDSKWQDWCLSLDMKYRPVIFPTLWRWPDSRQIWNIGKSHLTHFLFERQFKKVISQETPMLSDDSAIEIVTERLTEKLHLLSEYGELKT